MPDSLLNQSRPPVFCPGCSHERVVLALNTAFTNMGLAGHQVAIVSDIGCSGLVDTFFNTHALHGLHGRALTYAAGLKLARPDLTVVVTMGDGGIGIGGAHLLSACRRNLDLTLLVFNNFNYGMTGGQFSATTPADAAVESGFLNHLETPVNISGLAQAAGAAYTAACSSFQKNLPQEIEQAIRFEGFAVLDIRGICPGRYTKKNKLTPKMIDNALACQPQENTHHLNVHRKEFGRQYRVQSALQQPAKPPLSLPIKHPAPSNERWEVIILGVAGQRVQTAGEILCLAGMSAGLRATQKNDYHITVLRGPSISEIILSPEAIDFTGITKPRVILAIGQEGVNARKKLFRHLDDQTLIIKTPEIELPVVSGNIHLADFKALGIKREDWSLAALMVLARYGTVLHGDMLRSALQARFKSAALESALKLIGRIENSG